MVAVPAGTTAYNLNFVPAKSQPYRIADMLKKDLWYKDVAVHKEATNPQNFP